MLPDLPADWPFGDDRQPLLAALAALSPYGDAVSPSEAHQIAWALLADAEDGGEADCPAAAAWFARKDAGLWRGLHRVLGASPSRVEPLELLELCRLVRSHRGIDVRAIKAYAALWPSKGKQRLAESLAGIPELHERCLFLASYKPRGLVPLPPFALSAEILIFVSLEAGGAR